MRVFALLLLPAAMATEDDTLLLQSKAQTTNPGARCCASEKQMAKESDYAYAKCSCMGKNTIAMNEPKISQRAELTQAQCGIDIAGREFEWCEYPQGNCPYGFYEGDFKSEADEDMPDVLRIRSCNMNPLVEVTGDPHMRNLNGELFDLSREGDHILIQIPAGSGDKLEVTGTITAFHKNRKCPKFFMTQLKMKGSMVGDEPLQIVTETDNFGVKLGAETEYRDIESAVDTGAAKVQRCNENMELCKSTSPGRRTPSYANKVLVQLPSSISLVASNYASANPSFMNIAVAGLGTQDDVGGLLGNGDHSEVGAEAECQTSKKVSMLQKHTFKSGSITVGHL